MTEQPIGATVTYQWNNGTLADRDCEGYVSFGEYIEANEQDSYGVADEDVFYYCSQQELVEMLTQPHPINGWKLVSIDHYQYEEDEDE